MFASLGLKDKSILIVMLIIIILSFIFIYLNIWEHKYNLNFYLEKKEDRINNFLKINLKDISTFYIARAKANINSFGVKESLKNSDKDKLYTLTIPRYRVLLKENSFLKGMKFYSSKKTLILNMNDFNDSSTQVSFVVEKVIESKKSLSSFQFIDGNLYYSIGVPIEYEGKFIGVVEFSINPYQFLTKINQIFTHIGSAILISKNREYIVSNCCIESKIIKVLKKLKLTNTNTILNIENKNYMVHNHLALKNFENRKLATLILIQDITEDMHTSNKIMIYSIIITIVIILIIFLILQNSFGKIVKKIELKDLELENFVKKLETIVATRTKELKESREKYKNIINLTSEGYFEFDEDKKIINVNRSICKILNFSKDELIGKRVFDLMDEDNSEIFKEKISKVSTLKNSVFELTLKSFDGKDIYTIFSITLIKSKEIIFSVFLTDITKQQKLLEEMKERKVSDIKLASIGKLAAGVTHEINTPLTYIKGNLELIKFEVENLNDEKSKQILLSILTIIFEGITRISGIVNAMKEVAGKSSSKKELTNIYSTLIVALKMVYNRSKHISNVYINNRLFTLDLDINSEEYYAMVDKQKIEQVWIIILNNAIDEFTKLNMDFEDKFISIDIKQKNSDIHIFIKDNAGAIPKEILSKIFEPFMSTKVDKGMGLGLNIAKKIVKDNGGSIKAYNDETLDDLAIFEVILKVSEEKN